MLLTYSIIAVLLLVAELIYFRIADRCNIIDKPNERSSHSTIVLRGGGVIFAFSMIVWSLTPFPSPQGEGSTIALFEYWPFIIGLVLIAGVSFWDDVKSLPDSVRLVVQFTAMGLMFYSLGLFSVESLGFSVLALPSGAQAQAVESQWASYGLMALFVILAAIVCVGATNIINFMDGINGITAAYAIAILLPLLIVDSLKFRVESQLKVGEFIEPSFLIVAMIGVLVFCIFNFRPKGKAKCFAGDVGSIGIAFIMLFAIGKLILATGDITWLIFLLVYGVDGCCTIIHRIMLHENLGEAHRKHAFQLMANELKMGHVTVSLIYMGLQLAVSLGFIYLCPNTVLAHWIYLVTAGFVLVGAYVLFMMKYYHLHEEYLKSLRSKVDS